MPSGKILTNICGMVFPARWLLPAIMVALTLGGCEKAVEQAPVDTAEPVQPVQSDTTTAVQPPSAWNSEAGLVFFVRDPEAQGVMVVFPQYADSTLPDTIRFDQSVVRGMTVDILNRAGLAGQMRVDSMEPTTWADGCIDWPRAVLSRADTGLLRESWNAAFIAGRVRAVSLDSMESLSAADSAQLVVQLTRLASAIPEPLSSSFRGLPFVVRSAHRFTAAPGIVAVVADIVRKVNLEANPLEEHILMIAERSAADPKGQWKTVYTERASGVEERIETTDLLAAIGFTGVAGESGGRGVAGRTALLIARVSDETRAYALIERPGPGKWEVRWTSVRTGC
ncbi:MAG: hypothetical protein H7Z74_19060 [Anaerolineae bacterium]|nr:hypothetical protein [Gemmatimonadaceae bacterium]